MNSDQVNLKMYSLSLFSSLMVHTCMILINLRVSPPLQFTFRVRWSFHRFDPLGDLRIATKRCSEDSEIALVHSFNSNTIVTEKSEI